MWIKSKFIFLNFILDKVKYCNFCKNKTVFLIFFRIFRCTLTKIPESKTLLQKSRLPLGILIHPFKDLTVSIIVIYLIFSMLYLKF